MIEFVEYDNTFLELSWKWLNDPEIKALTHAPDFTKQQQQDWFNTLSTRQDYYIKGIVFNGTKVGVCGLKNITKNNGEAFAYVGEKDFWNAGIGALSFKHLLTIAKEKDLPKIYAKVARTNKKMIKVNKIFGYKIIDKKSDKELVYLENDLTKPIKFLSYKL